MSIVVYSKDNCPHCVNAKNLLLSKGASFNEIKIGRDIIREDFISLFPDVKTVPHIIIDGVQVGGYDKLIEWYKNNTQEFLAG